jgi:hypothetical protein
LPGEALDEAVPDLATRTGYQNDRFPHARIILDRLCTAGLRS